MTRIEISEEDLMHRIEMHKMWLIDPNEGCRLDLTDNVVRSTAIQFKDLSKAILYNTKFENVDLSGTKFKGAFCNEAEFINCNAAGASFEEASLIKATIDFKTGGLMLNLTNADLTDAKYNENLLDGAIISVVKNTDERIASALESIADSLKRLAIHS